MFPVKVGNNKLLGALMLGTAGLQGYVHALTKSTMSLVTAVVFFIIGTLLLVQALLVIHQNKIEVKNALGMTMKTVPFAALTDLSVEGKVLWVQTASGERRKFGGFGVDGSDMARLAKVLASSTS